MRLAIALAAVLSSPPAFAACRLSQLECRTLYREMTAEAEASAEDERHFHPAGLSRYDRAAALMRRHLDRVDERSMVLPYAIGNEWSRLEVCAATGAASGLACR